MKTLRKARGPFNERPYYTNGEIENTCRDELERVGLLPKVAEPIRIDRFIEKRFRISHDYEDLPDGILGYTRFSKSGVAQIIVARRLDDNSTVNERRIRTTLAHEAGHGLLHAHLFVVSGQSALFPEGQTASPRVLCRDERITNTTKRYGGEWWEYQANAAIGGLLLPRHLVLSALSQFLVPTGLLGLMEMPDENRRAATAHLNEVFEVNPIVAAIRIDTMFPKESSGQGAL